jgi:hypothetical protein
MSLLKIEDTKYGLDVRRFCDSEAKLATLKFLRRQKKNACGDEPKTPQIWVFLAEGFSMALRFFSESGWLSKCSVLANLNRKSPPGQIDLHNRPEWQPFVPQL